MYYQTKSVQQLQLYFLEIVDKQQHMQQHRLMQHYLHSPFLAQLVRYARLVCLDKLVSIMVHANKEVCAAQCLLDQPALQVNHV